MLLRLSSLLLLLTLLLGGVITTSADAQSDATPAKTLLTLPTIDATGVEDDEDEDSEDDEHHEDEDNDSDEDSDDHDDGEDTDEDGEKAETKSTKKKSAERRRKKAAEEGDNDEAKKDKDDDKEKEKEEKEEDITMTGRFVASSMTPISRRLEEWSEMSIEKIVAHGTQVKAGDVLVALDLTEIDKSISDLEHSIQMEKLAFQQAKEKLELLKKTTKIDLDEMRREEKMASEDLALFLKRDKKLMIEQQAQSLKRQEDYLSYQEEELEQLLKMYEADDLTEETEEIILKRTRDQVEQGRFYLKRSKIDHEDFLKTSLPRTQERIERSTERTIVALERAEATMPAAVREAELSLVKTEVTHERSKEKLATLKRDRKKMVIKSPSSGTVYYGKSDNGQFPSSRKQSEELRKNGQLKSDEVFMTILQLRPVHILADVGEDDLRHLKKGDTVKVSPKAFPDNEINAKVTSISKFPVDDGTFSVKLTCRLGSKSERIVPGMTCEVKVTPQPEKKKKKE